MVPQPQDSKIKEKEVSNKDTVDFRVKIFSDLFSGSSWKKRQKRHRGNTSKRLVVWQDIETCSVSPWNKFLYLKMGLKRFKQDVKRGLKLREEQQIRVKQLLQGQKGISSKQLPRRVIKGQSSSKGGAEGPSQPQLSRLAASWDSSVPGAQKCPQANPWGSMKPDQKNLLWIHSCKASVSLLPKHAGETFPPVSFKAMALIPVYVFQHTP